MSRIIPNSFQYPNYYSDELMWLLSGDEQKVLLYTVRRILGFHKEKDNISLTTYSEGITLRDGRQLDYGTGLNRSAVIKALEMLTACQIIIEAKEDHSQAGKCYSLQLDSDLIDLNPLKARQASRHQIGQQRTEKARAAARQVVSPTDQQVVSPTDQQVVSPTDQQVVSPTDQQVVSPTDPHVLFSRNKEETKGKGTPLVLVTQTPDGITDVLENIYPGHATNFQAIRRMYDLALKLKATADDVRKFPAWLETNHPKKADSPFAFLDLFGKSLQGNKPSSTEPVIAPRYNCAKCQDRFVYTLNGKPQQCDCWKQQEVAA